MGGVESPGGPNLDDSQYRTVPNWVRSSAAAGRTPGGVQSGALPRRADAAYTGEEAPPPRGISSRAPHRALSRLSSPTADDHLENNLLQSENERLHREVTTLRAALKAAGRVLGPYIDPRKGEPPRR